MIFIPARFLCQLKNPSKYWDFLLLVIYNLLPSLIYYLGWYGYD